MKKIKVEAPPTWICPRCSIERGYRKPLEGHIETTVTKCAYCSNYTLVMDIEDLVPPNEEP